MIYFDGSDFSLFYFLLSAMTTDTGTHEWTSQPIQDIQIHQADPKDFAILLKFDPLIETLAGRYDSHKHAIENGNIYFARDGDVLVWFILFNYQLYGHWFIELLVVGDDFRGKWIGTELICHVEGVCKTDKIFVSTNKSNDVMQWLLKKLEYIPSGHIQNINEEEWDHEEFFVKFLKK